MLSGASVESQFFHSSTSGTLASAANDTAINTREPSEGDDSPEVPVSDDGTREVEADVKGPESFDPDSVEDCTDSWRSFTASSDLTGARTILDLAQSDKAAYCGVLSIRLRSLISRS